MRLAFATAIVAMIVVVAASNYLVQFEINEFLTWGAFTYPVAFLVTDVMNRTMGPVQARRVVYVGFFLAVVLSFVLATPRIAIASGSAFLVAQLLDVYLFDRMRRRIWWMAPLVSSVLGSIVDTAIFFSMAFAGTDVPWVTLGIGDLGVKLFVALVMLLPFRVAVAATADVVAGARRWEARQQGR